MLGKATYNPKTGKATPEWTTSSTSDSTTLSFRPPTTPSSTTSIRSTRRAQMDPARPSPSSTTPTSTSRWSISSARSSASPPTPRRSSLTETIPASTASTIPTVPTATLSKPISTLSGPEPWRPKPPWISSSALTPPSKAASILALEHAIYGNIAPVLSLSFGACEENLGATNQFLSAFMNRLRRRALPCPGLDWRRRFGWLRQRQHPVLRSQWPGGERLRLNALQRRRRRNGLLL